MLKTNHTPQSIEMNQFLRDLITFREWHKNDGYILTLDQVIEMVKEEVIEIKHDHLLQDLDDAE